MQIEIKNEKSSFFCIFIRYYQSRRNAIERIAGFIRIYQSNVFQPAVLQETIVVCIVSVFYDIFTSFA